MIILQPEVCDVIIILTWKFCSFLFQLSGFRRGILNVAMRPAVLRSAVVQGGSTRRVKLDRNVGMDEVYFSTWLIDCTCNTAVKKSLSLVFTGNDKTDLYNELGLSVQKDLIFLIIHKI